MSGQHRMPGAFSDESEDTLPLRLSSASRSAAVPHTAVPVMGHQRDMLSELATQLDEKDITETPHIESPMDRCDDCGKRHLRRRLVCCVDGTWLTPDGVEGSFEGNASNVFRIWLAVKDGEVVDKDGTRWQQTKRYFKGIGANQNWLQRIISGITGKGFAPLIARIYEHCVRNCCPSQDEIFFFGFSRGAYIVRAVIGLFNDMGTLKPDIDDWNDIFKDSLNIYKSMEKHKYRTYHHLAENTRQSPTIKFAGLFDTVKALDDRQLYNISQTENNHHVRHALAILEARQTFRPERYENKTSLRPTTERQDRRTCVEAWFLGSHGDLGGSCKQDGLSLWPLQWILSEACGYGLVLGFQTRPEIHIEDPEAYTMPMGKGPYQIPFKNGANTKMWNLEEQFLVDGFQPMVNTTEWGLWQEPRDIFGDTSKTPATIVHPSVHFEDDMTPLGIAFLNRLKFREQIRGNRAEMDIRSDSLFWNTDYCRRVDCERSKTRILVCGSLGIGKSTLINLTLGITVTQESARLRSREHDINLELTKPGPKTEENDFVIHDASGFERGADSRARIVQAFLDEQKDQATFEDQLHCIWYCVQATGRLTTADVDFFKAVDFSYLTVIVVFTKCDELKNHYLNEACNRYSKDHPEQSPFESSDIPEDASPTVKAQGNRDFEQAKLEKCRLIKEELEGDFDCVFVSKFGTYRGAIEELRSRTRSSIRAEKLLRIHNQAVDRSLQAKLPQVLRDVIPWAIEARQKVYTTSLVNHTSPILDDLRRKMQERLPTLYNLEIGQQLIFKDFSALFSELYQNKHIPAWWHDDGKTWGRLFVDGVVSVGLGIAMVAVAGGAMTLAGSSEVGTKAAVATRTLAAGSGGRLGGFLTEATRRDANAATLLPVALMILMHERLYWLGIREIKSKEFLARAAVEILKIADEVKAWIDELLKTEGNDDLKGILTIVVDRSRQKAISI